MPEALKIAIVVHGRLHAFDLGRELIKRGHDVAVFTNYPKWAAKRFDLPDNCVRSCWPEGVATRLASRMSSAGIINYPEIFLHTWFSKWAAGSLTKDPWDVVLCWSGVGEETLRALKGQRALTICHRTSSHIRTQNRLLVEEEQRTGVSQERPSQWMISREEREYDLADIILVPSGFVSQSFSDEGVPSNKVFTIHLGVESKKFRPAPAEHEARCDRILSGAPLQILNVGTFSFRKGMWDLARAIKTLHDLAFQFRFIGPVNPEAADLVSNLQPFAEFIPPQPQRDLPAFYGWGDIFVLPTIEDGYQLVLAQANAAGLPILTTPNGAGHDLIREGENGWVIPIRDPQALEERLRWCDVHRLEVAKMVRKIYHSFQTRGWDDVVMEFEKVCLTALRPKSIE